MYSISHFLDASVKPIPDKRIPLTQIKQYQYSKKNLSLSFQTEKKMSVGAVTKYLFPFEVTLKILAVGILLFFTEFCNNNSLKNNRKSLLLAWKLCLIHTHEFSKTCIYDFEVPLFLLYRNDIVPHFKSSNWDKTKYLFQGSAQNCIPLPYRLSSKVSV